MAIARVELSGNINQRTARQIREVISYIGSSRKYGALILVVNSGGGDANSSELLMGDIIKLRKKIPVFSVIMGTGASGAYWIASGSTKIYAMNTSILGSIGVIGIAPNVNQLMNKLGIRIEVLKVGEYKDMLNPFTESSVAAREKYQAILEHSYTVFKNSISQNRKLSSEITERVSTGEIFSAPQALEFGLIDKIATEEDAVNDLVKAYGLKRKIREVSPRRSFVERVISSGIAFSFLTRMFRALEEI